MSAPETGIERVLKALSPAESVGQGALGQGGSSLDVLPEESPAAVAQRDGPRQPMAALLVRLASDTMTLHTRDGYWLFAGRAWDAAEDPRRIIGGQRAAAALNSLRHLSIGGNPYADWFLVCFDEQLTELRTRLAQVLRECEAGFEALKRKGLALTVLGSRQPLELSVAFGSSYGYAIAEAILEFDYYVRVVKTLVLKNRIGTDAGREAIREVARPLRRLFVRSIRWDHALRAPIWQDLTRRDFLPSADEATRERVAAAIARLGSIPPRVLSRTTLPRHVLRPTDTGHEGLGVLHRPSVSPDAEVRDEPLL